MFTSPTPDQCWPAAETTTARGVLFIVKNYAGDRMNFSLGPKCTPSSATLIPTMMSPLKDLSTPGASRRCGHGGEKVLGAAAERGDRLDVLTRLGKRVNEMTRSMGVALTSCTVPAVGRPTFELGENEMEMGVAFT